MDEPVKMLVADQKMLDNMAKVNVLAHEIGSLDQLIALANAIKAIAYQKYQEELKQYKLEQAKLNPPSGKKKSARKWNDEDEEDEDIVEEEDDD